MQAALQCGYDDPFIEPRLLHSYPAKAYQGVGGKEAARCR